MNILSEKEREGLRRSYKKHPMPTGHNLRLQEIFLCLENFSALKCKEALDALHYLKRKHCSGRPGRIPQQASYPSP
jgi:hypothetical protein